MISDGIVLEGYLDDEAIPGDQEVIRARFRLCISPTDELVDEMTLPCSVCDPELAHAVLHELRPGDQIRVTGYLALPRISGHPMWLQVTTIELLGTPPLPLTDATETLRTTGPGENDAAIPVTSALSEHGGLERYGPYISYDDPDTAATSVWTAAGAWVGTAVYPRTAGDLITAYEHRTADGT